MTLRAEFFDQITQPSGPNGIVVPLAGVSATPYVVNDDGSEGAVASAYASRLSSSTIPATITTSAAGIVDYFLDVGNYNIHYHDPSGRIPDSVRQFTAVTVESQSSISSILSGIDDLLAEQIVAQSVSPGAGTTSGGTTFQIIGDPGDVVNNVVVTNPLDLIVVWYTGAWFPGSTLGDEVAIFIDENQLHVPAQGSVNASVTQSAVSPVASLANVQYLTSTKHGLMNNTNNFTPGLNGVDASTGSGSGLNPGQAAGFSAGSAVSSTAHKLGGVEGKSNQGQIQGGPCYIETTPGVHSVSVRFKSAQNGHIVQANTRHLRVGVIPFPSS